MRCYNVFSFHNKHAKRQKHSQFLRCLYLFDKVGVGQGRLFLFNLLTDVRVLNYWFWIMDAVPVVDNLSLSNPCLIIVFVYPGHSLTWWPNLGNVASFYDSWQQVKLKAEGRILKFLPCFLSWIIVWILRPNLVQILKLDNSQYLEAEVWLRFWS